MIYIYIYIYINTCVYIYINTCINILCIYICPDYGNLNLGTNLLSYSN